MGESLHHFRGQRGIIVPSKGKQKDESTYPEKQGFHFSDIVGV